MAHLLTCIRFENKKSVKEKLLLCEPLLGRATSNEIFEKLYHFTNITVIE
jgi:hypothetical protein